MMQRSDQTGPPRAEELAAYADGELAPLDRKRIEAWLAEHPESAAEVKKIQHLRQTFRDTAAPEPSESGWAAVLERITRGLSRAKERQRQRANGARYVRLAGAALAATLLLAISFRAVWHSQSHGARPVLPVALATDVDIISVEAADAGALVVGELPLHSPIVLASPGDIALKNLDRNGGRDLSDVRMQTTGSDTPMIIAPLSAGFVKD